MKLESKICIWCCVHVCLYVYCDIVEFEKEFSEIYAQLIALLSANDIHITKIGMNQARRDYKKQK